MNDHDNQQNTQQTQESNYIDPHTVQAEVIGELRKDKIGRPVIVLEMFILFAIVLIGLPIANKLMNDQNSFLYKLFNPNNALIEDPIIEEPEFVDGGELQKLDGNTSMKFDNIVLKNFSLKGTTITCDIYSFNGVLELDNNSYFLEVYSASSENLIASVKLDGRYDNQIQRKELVAANLSINDNLKYMAKVVKMEDKDYPEVKYETNEMGIGTMSCSYNGRKLDYTFKNNYLIGFTDNVKIKLKDQKDNTAYLELKKTYENKSQLMPDSSHVEEGADGFEFFVKVDLEKEKIPKDIKDINYYELDKEAKIIQYTLRGRGFDCK